jgi:hypothetical protein
VAPLQGPAGPVSGPALSLRRVGRTGSFYERWGQGGLFQAWPAASLIEAGWCR